MARFLFEVENKNRLAQIGLLQRFSISCYGKQMTLEDIRSEKAEKYKELSSVRGTKEYDMWFLKYIPGDKIFKSDTKKDDTKKNDSKKDDTEKDDTEKDDTEKDDTKKNNNKKTRKVTIFDILRKNKTFRR